MVRVTRELRNRDKVDPTSLITIYIFYDASSKNTYHYLHFFLSSSFLLSIVAFSH